MVNRNKLNENMKITVRNFDDLQRCLDLKSHILGYKQRYHRVYTVVINDFSMIRVDLVKCNIEFDGMPGIKQVVNLIEEYLPNIVDEFDIIIEEDDKKLVNYKIFRDFECIKEVKYFN